MSKSLLNHGIVPRKSFIDCEFPFVPSEFFPHFVRGHFDGDGGIFKTGQGYYKISIVGTKTFIETLMERLHTEAKLPLKKIVKDKVHRLLYTKYDEILSFINYIYPKNENCFYLLRKYKVAMEAIKQIYDKCKMSNVTQHKGHNGRWRVRIKSNNYGEYKKLEDAIKVRNDAMVENGNPRYKMLFS
jgi:hypothetical protein